MSKPWDLTDAAQADALARAKAGQLLTPADVGAIFHLGRSGFYHRDARGDFDRLKTKRPIGPRCFSGDRVYRYVMGEVVDDGYTPAFGGKRRTG